METRTKTTYRLFQPGDEEQLSRFHFEVFKVRRPAAYFRWKYLENPNRCSSMAVGVRDGKIVGQIGSIPVTMKAGTNEVTTSQVVDILVAEGSRRGGTFFRLERVARDEEAKWSSFHYAFSIKNTFKIAVRTLGFHPVSPIFRMVKILNSTPYFETRIKAGILLRAITIITNRILRVVDSFRGIRIPSDVHIEESNSFDTRFDDLWERGKHQYEIMVARTSDYLNWRYASHPTVRYTTYAAFQSGQLKGYIVLCMRKKGEASGTVVEVDVDTNRGFVSDLFVEPGEEQEKIIKALLAKAIGHFRQEGADAVACWVLKHMELCKTLHSLGFVERETPHDLIVRTADPNNYTNDYLREATRWYIMRGDSDYE